MRPTINTRDMSRKRIVLFGFVALILIVIGCSYFVFFTSPGLKILCQKIFNDFHLDAKIKFDTVEGNLFNGLVFRDMELTEFKKFPSVTSLRIQHLLIDFSSLQFSGLTCEFQNARLSFPGSEPLVISGIFQRGHLDINIFGKNVDVREFLRIGGVEKFDQTVFGMLDSVDIYIRGPLKSPQVSGNFFIERLIRGVYLIKNAPCTLAVTFLDWGKDFKAQGELILNNGSFYLRDTEITIEPSRLKFNGSLMKPILDLKGQALVNKVKIAVRVTGTPENPDFRLFSDSLISQQRLLLMLATNRSWQGVDDSLNQGIVSADLAKDFFDYVFLNGSTHKLIHSLGLSDISLKFDGTTKGISFKKDILNALSLGYGLEETTPANEKSFFTQALEGEFSMTEQLSVGAERKFKQEKTLPTTQEALPAAITTEDKIFLKYNTKF